MNNTRKPEADVPGKSLLKGAAVLGAAAIISKLLGTLQKIPLQNMAGDGVFGIYNAVYPLYILILTVATAGIPIAVSKFVSEQTVLGRHDEAKRIFKLATAVLSVTGLLCFLLLYAGSGFIASWMGVGQTEKAIRSVSFALLLVPVMAALRGYFQGIQNMVPTAVSQVVEQFVRVCTMIVLLLYFTRLGRTDDWIAAGATFGSAVGAAAGLIVMLLYWWRRREPDFPAIGPRDEFNSESNRELSRDSNSKPKQAVEDDEYATSAEEGKRPSAMGSEGPVEPASSVIRRFLRYALPICLGSLVVPLLTLVDTFTMPRLLMVRGTDEAGAMYAFGLYNHGLPLVQLVSMIATSMSAALIPAIAVAKIRNEPEVIRVRSELAIRFTWLIGLAASFGLAATAIPLNIMFFKSAEGWEAMALLAFTAGFSTVNIVTSSILQGMGAVKVPVIHLLVGVVIKIALNLLLMPLWGIQGAAVAAVLAYGTASGLNYRYLYKHARVRISASSAIYRPLLAVVCMCGAIFIIYFGLDAMMKVWTPGLSLRIHNTILSLAAVAAGGIVYLLALFKTGAISRSELALVPSIGQKAEPILVRIGLWK
ncbi:polysaccharide biosynthesis protein [Paenibacillus sp. J2TS4]|uniref:putative polysaccharide biosynthesis protein n=1 Tax=Paenibacillus sp. J2TS4 TaxID=2807194 RepID=UPI0020BDF58B|nr:polysaccharide biosynthesis protein [Paenibacillus sp. J2TS4]